MAAGRESGERMPGRRRRAESSADEEGSEREGRRSDKHWSRRGSDQSCKLMAKEVFFSSSELLLWLLCMKSDWLWFERAASSERMARRALKRRGCVVRSS